MDNLKLTISQIGLYNPQRLGDEAVEKLFVVRLKQFAFFIEKICLEKPDGIPQHYLIIAQRGMGKTTLLKRIEVELRKTGHQQKFIPLLFPEEQYNLKNLAEFWLNSLDALADTLEFENKMSEVQQIDTTVKAFEKFTNLEDLARAAFQFLKTVTKSINRRPVMLIDNLNILFDRLSKQDQHVLRAWLMQNGAPIIIGASAAAIEDTYDYGAPFYDAFQIHYLQKLNFEELMEILFNLARLTHSDEIIQSLHSQSARVKTLHQLTGGNPRTATMLFKLIIKGFSKEINDDLEALLDEVTPLYKARFEELSPQMQVIIDAIALNWDPINLSQLRKETRYANNQLSPQLKRLLELGWIEKIDAFKTKGAAFQICERFFNVWFLMRRSSRRQKRELYCLSRFLESFYGDDLLFVAENSLQTKATTLNQVTCNFALAEAVRDEKLKDLLRGKSFKELQELANTKPELLNQFEVPYETVYNEILEPIKEYQNEMENRNFLQAEKLILKLAELTIVNKEINAVIYYLIGNLYQFQLQRYQDAESAYLKAIELDNHDSASWFKLGELYQNHLQKYPEAENAYKNALLLDVDDDSTKYKLIYLYRDDMNMLAKAEALLNSMNTDEKMFDRYWLNMSLIELYKRNEGIAKSHFTMALEINLRELSYNISEDWRRFGAISVRLGYGNWLLSILKDHHYNILLSPYFVAIKAMTESDPERYLNSRAVEIREPAMKLMELMRK